MPDFHRRAQELPRRNTPARAPRLSQDSITPRYWQIKDYPDSERARVLDRLLDLRAVLDDQVAATRSNNLLLATWNIRDFDSNKFGHAPRLRESFHYLAEIISRFDLVAVQEVNRDLGPLRRLLFLLGPDWDYIVTGVTEGPSGNEERMAFLFNTWQMSDHLLLWVELKVDFTNDYLGSLKPAGEPLADPRD